MSFDVSKFKPEEITIHSENGELVVEGKQEAKSDDGYSTRHFVRSYSLPRNIDRDSFKSRLSKEGILSIEAKKLEKPEEKDFIKIETENWSLLRLLQLWSKPFPRKQHCYVSVHLR